MKRILPAFTVLLLTLLACGQASAPMSSPPPAASTTDPAWLWILMRGEAKSDQAWGIDLDSQGNIYTAGYYQSPASALFFDMVIYKFDSRGNELWRTQWGDEFEQKAFIVVVDEPHVFVGGTSRSTVSLTEADMALLCLDGATGDVLWSFTWGQGYGYEEVDGLVVEDQAIYLSGWTTGETTSGDIAVLKLDRDGNLLWARTWGSDGYDTADGQMVVDQENIYVSGRYAGTNVALGGQAVLVKFDKASGEHLDHVLWGSRTFSDGLGSTSDGTYIYVVGLTIENANGQVFLLKYDKELNLLWAQQWGGPKGESARAVAVDDQGNILAAGSTFSYGEGGGDIFLLQYSPAGALNWYTTWGGPLNDTVQAMVLAGDFAFLVGSTENDSQGMNDALLIKASSRTGQFPQP